ncbi:hypothetical protein HYC85_013879 [Camellia sinensis]|uniref:Uncharacterized protein n=1 Tax=Camellia sinensis TaxID=4442 RepID=A0A7J7H4M0_CAMSI|nr:hypothetical protein HYC85_013879 [Camellia sinensis]
MASKSYNKIIDIYDDLILQFLSILLSLLVRLNFIFCKTIFHFVCMCSVDGGRPSSASIFVGGFVLGGIVVGALGCIYAPQISKALAGADRKDLMKKLSKFICDEEKALERTRKILTEKIAQLNSAIDDVSSQLRADDTPNGTAVSPDELEASI